MTALVWFVVRMYLNDLYISIPDRLLVVAAMAQLIQNIPTEVSNDVCVGFQSSFIPFIISFH